MQRCVLRHGMIWLAGLLLGAPVLNAADPVVPVVVIATPDGAWVAMQHESTQAPTINGVAMEAARGDWWTMRLVSSASSATLRAPNGDERAFSLLERSPDATAAVIIAGRWNWPDAARIAQCERVAGTRIAAIVAVGSAAANVDLLPCPLPILPTMTATGALAECIRDAQQRWRGVPALGELSFPMVSSLAGFPEAAVRPTQAWRVPMLAWTPWDDGARGLLPISDALRLLGVAARSAGVPLLLASSSGSGLLSHPLGERRDPGRAVRVAAQADGARLLLAEGGGDLCDRIDALSAVAWDEPLSVVLIASSDALRALAIAPDGSLRWSLSWDHAHAAAGWGRGTVAPLAAAWRRASATAATPMATLSATSALAWAADVAIEEANLTRSEWNALVAASANDPDARQLLIRATAPPEPLLTGRLNLDRDNVPSWLHRELMLRSLAHANLGEFQRWRGLALSSTDPAVCMALVRRSAQRPVFELLIDRLQAHASGQLPLPTDPTQQHRLIACIADDPRCGLRLRAWADALRSKLAVLARGPLDRYLVRTDPTVTTP